MKLKLTLLAKLTFLLLLESHLTTGQDIVFDVEEYMSRRSSPKMAAATPKAEQEPKCVLPEDPPNGHYDVIAGEASAGEAVDISTTLVYTCDAGFDIHSSDPDFKGVVVCEDRATWSHTVTCRKKNTPTVARNGCILPDVPRHGAYEVIGGATTPGQTVSFGTQLTYSCDDGYYVEGGGFVYCERNGEWSAPVSCKSIGNEPETPILTTTESTRTGLNPSLGSKCVLPPKPENGYYLSKGQHKTPGTEVDEFEVLSYHCDRGFTAYSNEEKQNSSFCSSGSWVPEIQCIESCRNLVSYSLDLTCIYKGDLVGCDGPMYSGTKISMKCKQFHSKVRGQPMTTLTCYNGHWIGNLPYCIPVCGEEKSKGQQFLIDAKLEDRDASPWHVGIYRLIKNKHEYQCGGTIVSNKVVITAAHCFDAGNGIINNFDEYKITAGKLYSDWEHNEINSYSYIQRNEIEALKIPPKYVGHELTMQHDIAVVIVKEVFKFTESVHPACMDLYDTGLYTGLLVSGKQGKVVGWGLTEEGNQNSIAAQLKKAYLPVVDLESCRNGVPAEFIRYTLVGDKFCAGFNLSGSTVCNGDSGGGFLVDVRERGVSKWYLMGVVSVGPKEDTQTTCRKNSFTLYTQVESHANFIENFMSQYK